MRQRIFRRGDIVETRDGRMGVVSTPGAESVCVDLIVRKPNLMAVTDDPNELTFIPMTPREKEYLLKRGLLKLSDYCAV